MNVTVDLPQEIEEAYLAAAQAKGVTVDSLFAAVLVSHVPAAEPRLFPELVVGGGIPVRRSGHPLDLGVVGDTIETIRRERDSSVLGQR